MGFQLIENDIHIKVGSLGGGSCRINTSPLLNVVLPEARICLYLKKRKEYMYVYIHIYIYKYRHINIYIYKCFAICNMILQYDGLASELQQTYLLLIKANFSDEDKAVLFPYITRRKHMIRFTQKSVALSSLSTFGFVHQGKQTLNCGREVTGR